VAGMTWSEIKALVVEIGCGGTRAGFKFAVFMFQEFPELRDA
jgi:hypothetical protein